MRSMKPGIPCSVAAISPSSSCAGTTTATRFPSSMTRSYGCGRLGGTEATEAAVARNRGDAAEDQSDQCADHKRGAPGVRRRLDRSRVRDDLGALDLLREG